MTVKELKKALNEYPDDMRTMINSESLTLGLGPKEITIVKLETEWYIPLMGDGEEQLLDEHIIIK